MTVRKLKIGVSKCFNSKVILIWDTLVKLPNGALYSPLMKLGSLYYLMFLKDLWLGCLRYES